MSKWIWVLLGLVAVGIAAYFLLKKQEGPSHEKPTGATEPAAGGLKQQGYTYSGPEGSY